MKRLYKPILRYLLKKSLIHYIYVHDNGRLGCARVVPWIDQPSYKELATQVEDQVVVMDHVLWKRLTKKIPNVIHIVIKPLGVRHSSGMIPDYLVSKDNFLDLLHDYPELSGKSIYILGGADLLSLTLPFTRRLILLESKTPIHHTTRRMSYPLELVDRLYHGTLKTHGKHVNRQYFKIRIMQRRFVSRFTAKREEQRYRKFKVRLMYRDVLEKL